MKFSDLTSDQQKRLVYGAAHEILRQTLDNGELITVNVDEFLPAFSLHDNPESELEFVNELQAQIEGIIMSDLFEKAAKHDV